MGAECRLRCAVHRVPASLWRIAVCTFHVPIGRGDIGSGSAPSGVPGVPIELYVIVLSVVSELLAFTAVGLVSEWARCSRDGFPCCAGAECPCLLPSSPLPSARWC